MPLPWPEPEQITIGLLILLRVGALIIMLPVLGHQLVPAQVKAGLIAILTFILYPVVSGSVPPLVLSPVAIAVVAVREIVIAAMLALMAQLIFAAAEFAGQIVSFQMGMTVANVFDPATSSQISVVSQLAMVIAMLLWVGTGLHHIFLLGLVESFRLMPIGTPVTFGGMADLISIGSAFFVLSLKIAAPIILLLLFIYIALGLLARAVPQIQVFFVSFPLTLGAGLLALALGMPAIVYLIQEAFGSLGNQLPLFLRHLAGG